MSVFEEFGTFKFVSDPPEFTHRENDIIFIKFQLSDVYVENVSHHENIPV